MYPLKDPYNPQNHPMNLLNSLKHAWNLTMNL